MKTTSKSAKVTSKIFRRYYYLAQYLLDITGRGIYYYSSPNYLSDCWQYFIFYL